MDRNKHNDIDKLLNMILVEGEGGQYIEIVNSVEQRFLIPFSHIRLGLSLYHASRIKGKMVKLLLPYISHSSTLLGKFGFRKIMLQDSPVLHEILTKTFQQQDLVLAIFCGTPGVHRKITIQVSHNNKVLGYCKISDKKEVEELFCQENKLLNTLRRQEINQVPQSLFYGELFPGIYMFIQNTAKKDRSVRVCRDMQLIWDFLSELNAKTSLDIPFEQSDYYLTLQKLKVNATSYMLEDSYLLKKNISEVEGFFHNNKTLFSVYHGDLTLSNCFIHHDKIYAFDWEYSKLSYPPFLDFFHFFTQCAYYEWKWNAGTICRKFYSIQNSIKKYIPDPLIYYKAYLLSVIQFYLERDKGNLNSVLQLSNKFWINILIGLDEKVSLENNVER